MRAVFFSFLLNCVSGEMLLDGHMTSAPLTIMMIEFLFIFWASFLLEKAGKLEKVYRFLGLSRNQRPTKNE